MDHDAKRCALPGCPVWIEDIPDRPARLYCTAAHRAAARQARRASMQPDQQARLDENLPWLVEPGEHSGDPTDPYRRPPSVLDPGPVGAATAPPSHPPGPALPADPAVRGRPRRIGVPGTGHGDPPPRYRRAVAVLGAVGILASGYAVTASQPVPPTPAAAVPALPPATSQDEWAVRAQITLASVERQLDMIAQTEEAWIRLPESVRAGDVPPAVEALLERKALLEQRRTALLSQLDTYRALDETMQELAESEQDLLAVERALEDLPPEELRSPEQVAAIAVLDEQRDLRLRQRDSKRSELAGMERNVENAARTPLPDDGEATTEVSNEVMDVMEVIEHDRGREGDPDGTPTPTHPEVVNGRDEQAGQERQDTATSAPPDPRGPRDESVEPRDDPEAVAAAGGGRDEGGPVGTVVGAVEDVVDGGEPAEPAPEAGSRPDDRADGGAPPKHPDTPVVQDEPGGGGRTESPPPPPRTERPAPGSGGPQDTEPGVDLASGAMSMLPGGALAASAMEMAVMESIRQGSTQQGSTQPVVTGASTRERSAVDEPAGSGPSTQVSQQSPDRVSGDPVVKVPQQRSGSTSFAGA